MPHGRSREPHETGGLLMRDRLLSTVAAFVTTAALLASASVSAVPILGAAAQAAANASAVPIRVARVSAGSFSPNRDGTEDVGVIRYYVPRTVDRLQLRISELGAGRNQNLRLIDLGSAEKGTYTWRWDGRDKRGEVVSDGYYDVELSYPGAWYVHDRAIVDTNFAPELVVGPGPALPEGPNPAIYPRSTVVRDALDLSVPAEFYEHNVQRLSLTIRDPRGHAVLRRVVTDVRTDPWAELLSQRWTARTHGQALPAGRYLAVVSGVDRAGNRGRTEQRIWVSKERLVWHEEVRAVLPDGSEVDSCFFDGGAGCADADYYNPPCGTVTASQMYVGGLSYRSADCAPGAPGSNYAGSAHWLPLPEALPARGVASARVGFVGAPTRGGGADVGTLSVPAREYGEGSSVTSGTAGETTDVVPKYWLGLSGESSGSGVPIPPGVLWSFATRESNAVDVKVFTVTARYLVVAD